jgi:hypothetical protein
MSKKNHPKGGDWQDKIKFHTSGVIGTEYFIAR